MAASGEKAPDIALLGKGQNRSQAEEDLGEPLHNVTLPGNSTVSVYRFERGNEPSYGRAGANLVFGVLTLGFSELAATPMEAVRGDMYEVPVLYDQNHALRKVYPARRIDTEPPKRKETQEREERLRTHDETPVAVAGVLEGFRKKAEARSMALFDAHKKILDKAGVDTDIKNNSLSERERVAGLADKVLKPGAHTLDLGRTLGHDYYVVVIFGEVLTPRTDKPPPKRSHARFR
jgi:hypothetical protein